MKPFAELDVDAVRRLPASPGLSFRGGGDPWWRPGDQLVEPGWLTTSRDPRIATDDFADADVVALFGACGRDLHHRRHRPEFETVFLPGSRFTVVRTGQLGPVRLQVVRVARDDGRPERLEDPEVQVRRAVAAVSAALSAPPVHTDSSERFAGRFGVPVAVPASPARPGSDGVPRRHRPTLWRGRGRLAPASN